MIAKAAIKRVLFSLLVATCWVNLGAQQPPGKWRALIVYTEPWEHGCPGWNWYEGDPDCQGCCPAFVETIETANLIYERSGLADTAEIAGVIRDQTHYVSEGSGYDFGHGIQDVNNPTGPLGRYIALLDEYAADVFILVDSNYSQYAGVAGGNSSTYSGFWTSHYGGHIWAHELGHNRGLDHCHGYRRSYDSLGNYVTSGSKHGWGFNTVMQYQGGAGCGNDGDYNDVTRESLTFSDTNLTWINDSTGREEVVGEAPYNIDRPLHAANQHIIPALANTPANVIIADTMSLARFDFADFLSQGQVTIEPGFSLAAGGKMRVTVGPSALAKRGVWKNEKFISGRDNLLKNIGPIANFSARYDPLTKSMKITFSGGADSKVSLAAFDVKGIKKGSFGEFQADGKVFSKIIVLNELPSGTYYFRVAVGSQNIYKQFIKK